MTHSPPKVFISYAREDYDFAYKLYLSLKEIGTDPWLDRKNLLPGQRWQPAIESAIQNADFFIAVLSENSIGKRGYVQKELRIGLDVLDLIPDTEIFLIPIRIENCSPANKTIKELQWVDFYPDWNEGFLRIKSVFDFQFEATKEPQVKEPGFALASDIINLIGTIWDGDDTDGDKYVYEFKQGGILKYDCPTGTFENGTWKQTDNLLYMEMNDKYSQRKGIISSSSMEGEAQNVAGHKWKWTAARRDNT